MGLFSKKNSYESAAMELEEQQKRRERSQAQASQSKPQVSAQAKAPTPQGQTLSESPKANVAPAINPTALLNYGIDDVIQLMRDLPDNKKEMVILIVQKTLISAKIDIKAILEKAARKIDNLQGRNDKLRSEIRDLEEMIVQKKSDVERIRRDMEETQQVRQSFESVFLRGSRAATAVTAQDDDESFPAPVRLEMPDAASS